MREVKKHVFWKTVRGACNQGPAGRWGAPLMIPQPFAVALSRQLLLESVRSDHPWQRECGRTNNHLSSVKGVAQVWLAYMPAGMAVGELRAIKIERRQGVRPASGIKANYLRLVGVDNQRLALGIHPQFVKQGCRPLGLLDRRDKSSAKS
eukprot:1161825-Pelagomonas_calceolata.AAC.9